MPIYTVPSDPTLGEETIAPIVELETVEKAHRTLPSICALDMAAEASIIINVFFAMLIK